ncbi:hypothetical protein ACIA8G_36565 [Lentzea sp. NPDC051213]|uniref:hypothetical protein n=1 Tax=Lentzea sp. NPDC051213 TaxID=3364126 RepID=UPI0037B3754A
MRLEDLDISSPIATDAGLFGLWRSSAFSHVVSLDQWEDDVAEDASLLQHIARGAFAPINIGGDGAFQFHLRGTQEPGNLTARERSHLLVSSQPYLLKSDGLLELGGLEGVGSYAGADTVAIPLDAGEYGVVVHLIDWRAENGAVGPDGEPTAEALPDFVVEVCPAAGGQYRLDVHTFDRPAD